MSHVWYTMSYPLHGRPRGEVKVERECHRVELSDVSSKESKNASLILLASSTHDSFRRILHYFNRSAPRLKKAASLGGMRRRLGISLKTVVISLSSSVCLCALEVLSSRS